ncbi:conjugative transfer TraN domain protein [Rickettsia hoogstraalii str. RCCE3]|nr:conjugative transfer TraN domain protein [Rickettsia hoogstraalii str. RCCE3]
MLIVGIYSRRAAKNRFSKFDLEELFSDLLDHAKSKMSKSFPQQLKNQMPIMQQQRSNNSCTDSNLSY